MHTPVATMGAAGVAEATVNIAASAAKCRFCIYGLIDRLIS